MTQLIRSKQQVANSVKRSVDQMSMAERIAMLPAEEKARILSQYTEDQLVVLSNDWNFWARPKQMIPMGNWTTWMILAGRGFGKALPLDTRIPTPMGYKTMGSLQVGDTVLGSDGQNTKITFATEVMYNHECYELIFDDGLKIVADSDHRWEVETLNPRVKNGRRTTGIKTTREIYGDSLLPVVEDTRSFHAIKMAKAFQGETKYFKISPKTMGKQFGLWSTSGICPAVDGCKKPNYLPYLWGSLAQRLEFMDGYLNSVGLLDVNGKSSVTCRFNTDAAAGFMRSFLASLGTKSLRSKGVFTCGKMRDRDNSQDVRLHYDVHFVPTQNFLDACNFYMPLSIHHRKYMEEATYRYIIGCRRAKSIPVRCITVDAPDHLFLCTERFLPTHNTRTGAETVRDWVRQGYKHIALCGQTKSDVRDTMLKGLSGLLTICQNDEDKPYYVQSRRVVIWEKSGAEAHLYSGDEPGQLRGPQHDKAWVDELVKFMYPEEFWDMLELGLRLGDNPQTVITTTPKPQQLLKDILADPKTHVTKGNTYENTQNLSDKFIDKVIKKYEGTSLGRQELYADILDDTTGALWQRETLDLTRVPVAPLNLFRIVVAVDPAVTSKETSDETGIIVAGLARHEGDLQVYVLEDLSLVDTPGNWSKLAVETYKKWNADVIVAY